MTRMPQALWKDEEGPTAVEYAILASLVAVVIAASVAALGISVQGLSTKVISAPW